MSHHLRRRPVRRSVAVENALTTAYSGQLRRQLPRVSKLLRSSRPEASVKLTMYSDGKTYSSSICRDGGICRRFCLCHMAGFGRPPAHPGCRFPPTDTMIGDASAFSRTCGAALMPPKVVSLFMIRNNS